jgi:hypothetical protein
MSLIEEGMYFEDAFEEIPFPETEVASMQSIQALFATGSEQLPYDRIIIDIFTRFETNKKEQNSVYQKGIQQAIINGVKACKEFACLMTDRECLEIGKMLSSASKKDKNRLTEMESKAADMVAAMSGKKESHGGN